MRKSVPSGINLSFSLTTRATRKREARASDILRQNQVSSPVRAITVPLRVLGRAAPSTRFAIRSRKSAADSSVRLLLCVHVRRIRLLSDVRRENGERRRGEGRGKKAQAWWCQIDPRQIGPVHPSDA